MSHSLVLPRGLWATALALALLGTVQSAAALVLDDFEDLSEGTVVASRTIGGVQVTFGLPDGVTMFGRTYSSASGIERAFGGAYGLKNTPLNPANVSGGASAGHFVSTNPPTTFNDVGNIRFLFDRPVSAFGLTTLDLLESDGALALVAFNAAGQEIARQERTDTGIGSGGDLDWLLIADGIARVDLFGQMSSISSGYGIDDLVLEPMAAPLPPAAWLLLSALAGLGGLHRRQRPMRG